MVADDRRNDTAALGAVSHSFSDRVIPLPTNFSVVVLRKMAACALLAMTLCAGCTGPLGGHKCVCNMRNTRRIVRRMRMQCTECESGGTCDSPAGIACPSCCFESCQACLATAQCCTCSGCLGVWHCVEPCMCWPVRKCCYVLNFCARTDTSARRNHPVPAASSQCLRNPCSRRDRNSPWRIRPINRANSLFHKYNAVQRCEPSVTLRYSGLCKCYRRKLRTVGTWKNPGRGLSD